MLELFQCIVTPEAQSKRLNKHTWMYILWQTISIDCVNAKPTYIYVRMGKVRLESPITLDDRTLWWRGRHLTGAEKEWKASQPTIVDLSSSRHWKRCWQHWWPAVRPCYRQHCHLCCAAHGRWPQRQLVARYNGIMIATYAGGGGVGHLSGGGGLKYKGLAQIRISL